MPKPSPGSAIGTPAYMSPEQASGRLGALGPATDVYGLGRDAVFAAYGHTSVRGRSGGDFHRVQRGEMTPPRRVNARVPPALEAICLKAMALNPDHRYATRLPGRRRWSIGWPTSLSWHLRSRWLHKKPPLGPSPSIRRGLGRGRNAGAHFMPGGGAGRCHAGLPGEKEAREYAVEQEQEAHRQRASTEARAAQIEERFRADRQVTEQVVAVSMESVPENTEDDMRTWFQRRDYFLRLSRKLDAATGFAWDLAGKYLGIADPLRRRGRSAEAAAWYEKARLAYDELASERRDEPVIAFELAGLYLGMGLLHAQRPRCG